MALLQSPSEASLSRVNRVAEANEHDQRMVEAAPVQIVHVVERPEEIERAPGVVPALDHPSGFRRNVEAAVPVVGKINSPDGRFVLSMKVHRDPSCRCCESWAGIAPGGDQVDLQDNADMAGLKKRLGVPEELASCHTTEVDGMVIVGRVPIDDVTRLLRQKSSGIKGIAVPGMPAGAPGMEVPDGTKQPFDVLAFDATWQLSLFRGSAAGTTKKEGNIG